MKKQTYYSNGKLLLTGEYLILKGAESLALPTQFGQDMSVQPIEQSKIYWKSYGEKGGVWFQTVFNFPLQDARATNRVEERLLQLLRQAQNQNPNFLTNNQGYKITTRLDFPRNWGLGTSSTLINNLAQWAEINPFQLLHNTMGGSGYDVACAGSNTPIHYKLEGEKAIVSDTFFNPKAFKDNLFFVHLNIKQDSQKEVQKFLNQKNDFSREVAEISQLTNLIERATTIQEFAEYIKVHEEIMGFILRRNPVQKVFFKDYFGQIKSLGAWGGDFIIATGNADTPKYFKKKGFEKVLLYKDMVL